MTRKKEVKSKRIWDNISYYSSDITKIKNLNEIYRFVYYKPRKYHLAPDRTEWIYIDISLDDLLDYNSEAREIKRIITGNYDFVARLRSTGIKDKFGNLIFEGDVTEIKISRTVSEKGCVMYCSQSGTYSKGGTFVGSYQKQTEIIGDIFQTPELVWRRDERYELFGIEPKFRKKETEDETEN